MSGKKDKRLSIIRKILEEGKVHTQIELRSELKKKGLDASQATISRTLKELGYARIPDSEGSYRLSKVKGRNEYIHLLFKLGLEDILAVGNLILIKTRPGNAQAVAGAIDRTRVKNILGTVAGDDTIIAVTKDEKEAQKAIKNLKKFSA